MPNVRREGKKRRSSTRINSNSIDSFVLDGFPLTKKHVELLTEKGIIPYKLFELECDITECTVRAMKDRSDPT